MWEVVLPSPAMKCLMGGENTDHGAPSALLNVWYVWRWAHRSHWSTRAWLSGRSRWPRNSLTPFWSWSPCNQQQRLPAREILRDTSSVQTVGTDQFLTAQWTGCLNTPESTTTQPTQQSSETALLLVTVTTRDVHRTIKPCVYKEAKTVTARWLGTQTGNEKWKRLIFTQKKKRKEEVTFEEHLIKRKPPKTHGSAGSKASTWLAQEQALFSGGLHLSFAQYGSPCVRGQKGFVIHFCFISFSASAGSAANGSF